MTGGEGISHVGDPGSILPFGVFLVRSEVFVEVVFVSVHILFCRGSHMAVWCRRFLLGCVTVCGMPRP